MIQNDLLLTWFVFSMLAIFSIFIVVWSYIWLFDSPKPPSYYEWQLMKMKIDRVMEKNKERGE
jgi:hypothetical protein